MYKCIASITKQPALLGATTSLEAITNNNIFCVLPYFNASLKAQKLANRKSSVPLLMTSQISLTAEYPGPCHFEAVSLKELDTQLSLLCTFLPSVALRTTNSHTVCFLCCLTLFFFLYQSGYVVTEYPRIHLFLGDALKWQGILNRCPFP